MARGYSSFAIHYPVPGQFMTRSMFEHIAYVPAVVDESGQIRNPSVCIDFPVRNLPYDIIDGITEDFWGRSWIHYLNLRLLSTTEMDENAIIADAQVGVIWKSIPKR